MDSKNNNTESRLAEENRRLLRAVEELSSLNEIATAISSTMALDKIVDLIVQKCVKHFRVEQAAVMLLEEKTDEKQFHTMIRKADSSTLKIPYHFDTQLTGWMLQNQKPLIINDFSNDDRFKSTTEENDPIRSLLSVPMFLKGRMIGSLTCFNKKTKERFTVDDQRLLSIIAAQSVQVIENARLYEKEQTLFRMQEEFRLASEIQYGLLPKSAPRMKGYDITGVSYPARVVGGDYYDFIPIDKNRLAVCVGDISGKGLPAALLMANLQATIRGQTLLNPRPKDCLQRSNKLLYQSTDPKKFATLFYGILDTEKNQFFYSNAGQNKPILFSENKRSKSLETAGIALSFMENFSYEEGSIVFNPGDVLLIYTDGITEAMNASDEEFGEKKLTELVKTDIDLSANELTKKIVASVKQHAGDRDQSDDFTLVIIKRQKLKSG